MDQKNTTREKDNYLNLLQSISSNTADGNKNGNKAYMPESRAKYLLLLSEIPDVVWITDKDNRIVFISDNVKAVTGYSAEEEYELFEREKWTDRIHPEDVDYYKNAYDALFDKQLGFNIEYRFRRRDGQWIWLHDRAMSTHEEEYGERYATGLLSDATERKHAELQIRELNEKYESLIKNVPDVIYSCLPDETASMIFISERYAEWVGRPVKFFYENPGAWPDTIYPEDKDRAIKTYINACKNKGGYYQEYRVVKKDSSQFRWVRDHAIPILDEQGEIIRFDGTITDITEQYELRESLEYYTSALTNTQEEERRRIALELHDGSIQALFSLTTEINELIKGNKQLAEKDLRKMKKIQIGINSIMNDLRRFCHELRPSVLDHLGLIPSLELLVDELNRSGGKKCYIEVIGHEKRLSSNTELALFRITQEALNNIKKHSRAKGALVRVKFNDYNIELECIDDGCGFKMPRYSGGFARDSKLGVLGMFERARLIGGTLSIKSSEGEGTTVTVVAPIK